MACIFVNSLIPSYNLKTYIYSIAKLTSESFVVDSNYYNYHVNTINNNKEISFYQGADVEKS